MCFQALPFLMDFKRGLLLILYKAYKLDYCFNNPSVKRCTQTFTRSLFDRILPPMSLSNPAPYCNITVCHYVIDWFEISACTSSVYQAFLLPLLKRLGTRLIIHVNYITTKLCCEYSMLYDSGCFISADTTQTDAPGHGSKLTAWPLHPDQHFSALLTRELEVILLGVVHYDHISDCKDLEHATMLWKLQKQLCFGSLEA